MLETEEKRWLEDIKEAVEWKNSRPDDIPVEVQSVYPRNKSET